MDWDKSAAMKRARGMWRTNAWDCEDAKKYGGTGGRLENSPVLIARTCHKRTCPVCGPYWQLKNFRRFGFHIFSHDGQLYVDSIADIDWSAIAKDMRRRAKKLRVPLRYVAIRNEDNALTVISSVPVLAIARPLEKAEALDLLERAVDAASMEPRPITGCRDW
jgi:hypothetical protein